MTSIINLRKKGKILTFSGQKCDDNCFLLHMINRILQSCSCIIEFIKLVAKKRKNAQQASHFITFPQIV